jgi:fatty acid-binding protein DegV
MDRKESTIRVQCTCCDAVLTVDKTSGEVVFTEKPKNKKYSFEDAFEKVKQDQETAEDRFKEAFMKEKDRMKVIDQKFEEAMKRKDDLEMPIKPIDLD